MAGEAIHYTPERNFGRLPKQLEFFFNTTTSYRHFFFYFDQSDYIPMLKVNALINFPRKVYANSFIPKIQRI